mgnify:CR=1 FL=1
MHKPVRVLRPCEATRAAAAANHRAALAAALLQLPARFSEGELYRAVCGLSYAGDVRMGVAESPHKVRDIVAAQLPALREIFPCLHFVHVVRDPRDIEYNLLGVCALGRILKSPILVHALRDKMGYFAERLHTVIERCEKSVGAHADKPPPLRACSRTAQWRRQSCGPAWSGCGGCRPSSHLGGMLVPRRSSRPFSGCCTWAPNETLSAVFTYWTLETRNSSAD